MPTDKPNLFLIGYRATGKSATGRSLAQRLGWRFVDADVALEQKYGTTIRQIFADEGEAGFRAKETDILREICRQAQQVVATGGGVVLREENRALLRDAGQTVWLQALPETINRRMQQDKTTAESRPDLAQGGLQEIEELLHRREPLYEECADFAVDTEGRSAAQVAAEIYNWIHDSIV